MFCKNCSLYNDKLHWKCCAKPFLAKTVWLLAILSLIGAWASGGGIWWGWDGLTWYWNALVLGVLALGFNHHKSGGGGCGKCADGKCGTREEHDK